MIYLRGLLALLGGFLLHLTLGTLYCFGNMSTYMTSYMRVHVHPDILYSDMIWIPTLAAVGQGSCMVLSGYFEDFLGVRKTILLGAALMSSGVLLTYFTIQVSVLMTINTYGLMFGLGTALAYAPPLGVAMKWFPNHKGLVNGVIVSGYGLGAFLFNQIQTAYMNPKNLKIDSIDGYFHDSDILNRVPSTFLLLGLIYATVQVVAILMITSPSNDQMSFTIPLVTHDSEEEDADEEDDDLSFNSSQLNLAQNLEPKQIVKCREFWMLWCTFFLNSQAIGYINSMYKAYGQTYIHDDHFLATVGSVAAIFNAVGRLVWGRLCDQYGYRVVMMIITASLSLLFSSLHFIVIGGKALFAFWIWSIFFFFCGTFVLLPTTTANCFGIKHSSKNYGLVMTGQAVGAPCVAFLTQYLNDTLGWFSMFMIIAGTSCVSCCLNFFFPSTVAPGILLRRINKTSSL